jgi:hypothetical protein
MVLNGEITEILRILIENEDKAISIRKITLLRKINYKSAYNAIIKLEKYGLVKIERFGNLNNCSFTKKLDPLVFYVEDKRREDLIKNKNFNIIYSKLNKLKFPFICLVFGSFAKGNTTKNSDIDLLIIGENEKEIKRELSLIPLNIHSTFINYDEFNKMLKSNEFSVVSEAIKKNIILNGIENYYNFIEEIK